ncbi:MAG: ABC transporter permease [Acidimicrobiales bacterium]
MSDTALLLSQVGYGLRGFVRNARSMVFTVVMPVVLLLLFNSIFTGSTQFKGSPVAVANYFTPGIVAYSIMLAGYSSLLVSVVTARERGIIKRFRGTPMPAWIYLASLILQSIVTVAATVVVLVGMGLAFYDLRLDAQGVIGLAVYTVLGTATMCALGLALTSVATTADSASAIGPFSVISLAFISGVFIPVSQLPAWLRDLGRIFPLAHLANGLQSAFIEKHSTGLSLEDVGVLAIWALAGVLVALWTFRWEPQGR